MYFSAKLSGWAILILIASYFGVSWVLMWGLILPENSPRPEAERLKSALYLTHGPALDIVTSRKRLFKEYPSDEDYT